ncbi:hypothetical protein Tco_1218841 [Tanacetum coccineum]
MFPTTSRKDDVTEKDITYSLKGKQIVVNLQTALLFKNALSTSSKESLTIVNQANEASGSIRGKANKTDNADESNIDLSNRQGDDDVASSSLDFIQTLLDETPANELTDFMSHLVYIDAQTTLVVHNPEGNPELTVYISNEEDVFKPRSFERHMSKSTKPHPCFYNNDYTYLVDLSTKEKYTTSITKHYAARYYKEGIGDRIPERWSKEVRHYHFEALKSTTWSESNRIIIQENKIDICQRNKWVAATKGLKGKRTDQFDVKSLNEMMKIIDEITQAQRAARRLEELCLEKSYTC